MPLVSAGTTGTVSLNVIRNPVSVDSAQDFVKVEATVPEIEIIDEEPDKVPLITGAVAGVGVEINTFWIYVLAVVFLLLLVLLFYQIRKNK